MVSNQYQNKLWYNYSVVHAINWALFHNQNNLYPSSVIPYSGDFHTLGNLGYSFLIDRNRKIDTIGANGNYGKSGRSCLSRL